MRQPSVAAGFARWRGRGPCVDRSRRNERGSAERVGVDLGQLTLDKAKIFAPSRRFIGRNDTAGSGCHKQAGAQRQVPYRIAKHHGERTEPVAARLQTRSLSVARAPPTQVPNLLTCKAKQAPRESGETTPRGPEVLLVAQPRDSSVGSGKSKSRELCAEKNFSTLHLISFFLH